MNNEDHPQVLKHQKRDLSGNREDSSILISRTRIKICDELGEDLCRVLETVRTPQENLTLEERAAVRNALLKKIRTSRVGFLTALRDRFTATDSLSVKIAIIAAITAAAAVVAGGVWYLIHQLTAEPVALSAVFGLVRLA